MIPIALKKIDLEKKWKNNIFFHVYLYLVRIGGDMELIIFFLLNNIIRLNLIKK